MPKELENTEVVETKPEEFEDTVQSNQLTEDPSKPEKKPAEETTETKEDPPAFTPNYKFKVLDKEQEIDEFLRGAIKDADTEKKVRELYEKAYGLDHVKSQRDQERENRTKAETELNGLVAELQELGELRKKDLGLFFEKIGLPKKLVAQWTMQQAEALDAMEKLPEGMRGIYTELEKLRQQNYDFQKKLEETGSSRMVEALEAKRADLNATLASAEIAPIAQAFDARLGKPGSFEQMVKRHGAAEWEASQGKRDLSAAEAAREVIQILGLQPTAPSQAGGGTTQPKTVPAAKPTVLPNVGSGTATPTAKAPVSSMAELRKRAAEAANG